MRRRTMVIVLLLIAMSALVGCSLQRDDMTIEGPKKVSIFDRADWELDQSLAKLTWKGSQKAPIATVVLRTKNWKANLHECRRFQSQSGHYGNDEFFVHEAEVTPNEFKQLLKAVRPTVEPLFGNHFDPEDLSFVVLRRSGNAYEGFEALLSQDVRSAFYRAVLGALEKENENGRQRVRTQAIDTGTHLAAE